MKNYFIILILVLATLFTHAQTTQTYTFKIEGMSCDACASSATKILQGIKGVDNVNVSFDTKTAIVKGNVTKADIKKVMKEMTNFEIIFEGGSLVKPLTNEERAILDIITIKGGGKIKIKDHLSSGKITIFDFYADWCAPCRVFSPKVEHFIKNNPNIALRKVDIVNWKSEISKQLTKNYKMPALPFTLIFSAKGKLLGKVEGNRIEEVKFIVNSKN